MKKYDFKEIEQKWQQRWDESGSSRRISLQTAISGQAKVLLSGGIPYPSGQGLHVGHPRSYTALDAIARKKRLEGYNVLYPMGGTLSACRLKTMPLPPIFILLLSPRTISAVSKSN